MCTREPRTFSDDDAHFLPAVANVIAGLVERGRVESQLRTFLDAAPDATLVVDNGGRVVSANPQATELTGYSVDDLVGMTVEQLVPQRFRSAHAMHREGYGGEPRLRPMGAGREMSVLTADGTEVAVDIIEVAVSPDISVASIDPAQVERILENLLGNVERHTPRGTPCRIAAARTHTGILLTVEDRGPGVPDAIKESIFEAFQRQARRAVTSCLTSRRLAAATPLGHAT